VFHSLPLQQFVATRVPRIINQNIAVNSERFIMGPSRVQLENVVARSASAAMESTPRFIVETVQSDDDGALQNFSTQPRDIFTREMVRFLHPRLSGVIAALRRSTLLL